VAAARELSFHQANQQDGEREGQDARQQLPHARRVYPSSL